MEGWTFISFDRENGRRKVDENCILDEDLVIFDKHIAIFGFLHSRDQQNPNVAWDKKDDILILNLASRKHFWIQTKNLVQQMKEKATAEDGIPYNEYDVHRDQFIIDSMKTRTNEIEIQCGFETWMPAGAYAAMYAYIG